MHKNAKKKYKHIIATTTKCVETHKMENTNGYFLGAEYVCDVCGIFLSFFLVLCIWCYRYPALDLAPGCFSFFLFLFWGK